MYRKRERERSRRINLKSHMHRVSIPALRRLSNCRRALNSGASTTDERDGARAATKPGGVRRHARSPLFL